MTQYEWTEIFTSIEGEGPLTGRPTTYIRFARCNFTCGKFNNPNNLIDKKGYASLSYDPQDINSISELAPIAVGCDTQYAVNPAFSHAWRKGSLSELVEETMDVVPHCRWVNPNTGLRTILSLTGGEPTLRQKTIPALLNHEAFNDLEIVLIETNAAVPLTDAFIAGLDDWIKDGFTRGLARQVIWSNSPKLSASGEPWGKAIRPEIAMVQREIGKTVIISNNPFRQYFKFVCSDRQQDFIEVEKAMTEYYNAGVPRDVEVLIMPESCTEEQQNSIAANVADMCIDRGYTYCHRVHNTVYNNAIGK